MSAFKAKLFILSVFSFFSCVSNKSEVNQSQNRNLTKGSNDKIESIVGYIDGSPIYIFAEKMPQFEFESDAKFLQYILQNVKIDSLSDEERMQAKVYVSFVIDTTGQTRNVKIFKPKYPNELTRIENEFIRIISSMPKWTPAMNANEKVAVKLQHSIHINLNN